MTVVVNGTDVAVDHPVQVWEELLGWLDAHCAADGLVVSDVMFDGVGWPTYRDPAERQRAVQGARIEVWAITVGRLLETAIDDALGASAPLERAACSLATQYRSLDLGKANLELGEFANSLASFIVLTGNITSLVGQALGSTDGAAQGTTLVTELTAHVDGLIAARASGDTVTVADILEFDVVDALHKCVALLGTARDAASRMPAAA
jgi:hypothetical protein